MEHYFLVILLSIGEHSRDVTRYSPWGGDGLLSAPKEGPSVSAWATGLANALWCSWPFCPAGLRQEGTLLSTESRHALSHFPRVPLSTQHALEIDGMRLITSICESTLPGLVGRGHNLLTYSTPIPLAQKLSWQPQCCLLVCPVFQEEEARA